MYSYRIRADVEWTSATNMNMDAYLSVEEQYIDLVKSICTQHGINELRISGLEDQGNNFSEGQNVSGEELVRLLYAILREEIWCRLISSNIEFHFGYNYYMYCVSEYELSNLDSSLKIEQFESPYL